MKGFTGLFTDEQKSVFCVDRDEIAEKISEQFQSNHMIPSAITSIYETDANCVVENIKNDPELIMFSDESSALVHSDDDLLGSDGDIRSNILTSIGEISDSIAPRPNKTSVGPYGTPYTVIKRFGPSVLIFLTVFFNQLLANGYFPKCWRKANVIPIPKSDRNPDVIFNWRPISQINCISKIFEKVLQRRINRSISILPNIFSCQFGFRERLSTCHPCRMI